MKFSLKKQIANIITSIRIILSIPLFFSQTFSPLFYVFYILCGVSDMIDGTIARKTHSQSEFGQKLDSIADFIFIVVCLIKIITAIQIQTFIWIWILIIALIKIANVIIGYITKKEFIFLHTILNKITGFVLFIFPLTINFIPVIYSASFCCLLATVAAIQEGFCLRKTLIIK